MKSMLIMSIFALSMLFLFNSFNSSNEYDSLDLSSYQVEWCVSDSGTKYPCE